MKQGCLKPIICLSIILLVFTSLFCCSSNDSTTNRGSYSNYDHLNNEINDSPFKREPIEIPTFPEISFETTPQESNTYPALAPSNENNEFFDIQFISYPTTVRRNEEVHVKIKGRPRTMYSITVYYPSGPSTASGLYDKMSDENGYVIWHWKIGGRTSQGTHEIVVEGDGKSKSKSFYVEVY